MRRAFAFLHDERGATAAEFGLVLAVFLALVFGILGLSFTVWANSTLQYAAEAVARCASVNAAVCTNATATKNYAASVYKGPSISPVFNYIATGSCGHQVTATANMPLDVGLVSMAVPLSASACFP
ncbi:MAG TPA: TadE/TadG family type IV pilus assembly protein [Rhizomicrobium sp.]